MKRPSIYFGYQTALQIARAISAKDLAPARKRAGEVSDHSPSNDDVDRAITRLEAIYPSLRVEKPAHVLVGTTSRCRPSKTCKPHVCSAPLSGKSFYRLDDGVFVSSTALSFIHMATLEKSRISLLELGYELCGTYQTSRTGVPSAYQVPALASVRELHDYAQLNESTNGARKVLRAARYLADDSASPRETKLTFVLGLPKAQGGGALGIPRLNWEVRASKEAQAISGKASFRCDLCWPEIKLDVEYQSREAHGSESSRLADSRRTNALVAMGWTVIGVTNDELDSLAATDTIIQSIRRRLKKPSRTCVSDYHARKLKLRRQLGLPVGYD